MKSLFEQLGGTYIQQGDYYLPDLQLPPEEKRPIGVWGQRRLRYLREHRPILYTNLKTSGQHHSHLADVEEQANDLFLRLVKTMPPPNTSPSSLNRRILWSGCGG